MEVIELIRGLISKETNTLDLSGLGLTSFPEEIFNFPELETLKLMNNNISEIPYEITKLHKLKNLYLCGNKIRKVSKKLLVEMPYLDVFDLGLNPVDHTSSVNFHWKNNKWYGYAKCLEEIERRKHSGSKMFYFHDTIKKFPAELFQLTQIEYLSFCGIEISEIPQGLSNLQNLQHLDLSGNKLTKLPEDILGLSRLESICLDSNQFEVFPDFILELPNIERISINNNKLKYLNKRIFSHRTLTAFVAVNNPFENFDSDLFNWDFATLKERYY